MKCRSTPWAVGPRVGRPADELRTVVGDQHRRLSAGDVRRAIVWGKLRAILRRVVAQTERRTRRRSSTATLTAAIAGPSFRVIVPRHDPLREPRWAAASVPRRLPPPPSDHIEKPRAEPDLAALPGQ